MAKDGVAIFNLQVVAVVDVCKSTNTAFGSLTLKTEETQFRYHTFFFRFTMKQSIAVNGVSHTSIDVIINPSYAIIII